METKLITAYISGFSVGFSLILAIGAQNAFVLKQGLKKEYVFIVCLICSISDAILISAGVAGFGAAVKSFPLLEIISRIGGAIFLFIYALFSFKNALTKDHFIKMDSEETDNLIKTILICLGFTWLNPHVYLDTVVLLGSVSTKYLTYKTEFAMGAVSASFLFFFSLGYGARVLIPIMKKAVSWKIFEFCIGIIMLLICGNLLINL